MDAGSLFGLNERIVVITGGLGQLGRQFSRAVHTSGAKVVVLDLRTDDDIVAERFGALASDSRMMFLSCDVTSRESLVRALGRIRERWGVPHGLVNNAALDSPPNAPVEENGPFEAYPEDSWEKVMQVNVKGAFLCCQVIGGAMAREGRGSIVNIGSIYGIVSPNQDLYEYRRRKGQTFYKPVAYAVSKSALLNLTRYLATYWGQRNVRVNTLSFGGVFADQDAEFLKAYCARVPLGRMARNDEYNGTVVFLLSEASSYLTGANIVVDGGWTAW